MSLPALPIYFSKKGLIISIIVLSIVAITLGGYWWLQQSTRSIIAGDDSSLLQQIGLVLNPGDEQLTGEADDQINILLLGIGGEGHDGGTLTDSIIVASIKPSTQSVALVSLPRDLIVKIDDDYGSWEGRKINYAYSLGGIELAKAKVTEVTGLPIHYYVLLDFNGFKNLVDDVDGLEVTLPKSFSGLYGANELSIPCPAAQLYQKEDGAYCAISFTAGEAKLDGERALIYSRIRKLAPGSANPEEGSDFARAQRQQLILEAFKAKVFSSSTLLRPDRINNMMTDIGDHLETDVQLWEMVQFADLLKTVDTQAIHSLVVDEATTGLVYSTRGDNNASVVVPTAGDYDYSAIQAYAATAFEQSAQVSDTTTTPSYTLAVLNGTSHAGLAAQTAQTLKEADYTVAAIGNAPTSTYAHTMIYPLTTATAVDTTSIQTLQQAIAGQVSTDTNAGQTLLDTLNTTEPTLDLSTADIIIILGEDAI